MGKLTDIITAPFGAIETFFDGIKLGYKWRFNRFKNLRIETYRGFGTPGELRLKGRVLDDRRIDSSARNTSVWQNIRNTLQRIDTDEIPGACVRARYGSNTLEAETGHDGFFELVFRPDRLAQPDDSWQEIVLDLVRPDPGDPEALRTKGYVFVPREHVEYGVISDLDDTVIRTGATDRFKMMRAVLLNNAHTRMPFAGVSAFYRALNAGPDDRGHNPLFYISSSPWNLYDLFDDFMAAHDIPVGPMLFRNFGFNQEKFLGAGHLTHKTGAIRSVLETYPDLPFVLIGDSGQRDAETYREVVRNHPGRIRAVYIRDVTPEVDDARDAEVHDIAREVEEMGVPMVLVEDTGAAAEHARSIDLIRPAAVDDVRAEVERDRAGAG